MRASEFIIENDIEIAEGPISNALAAGALATGLTFSGAAAAKAPAPQPHTKSAPTAHAKTPAVRAPVVQPKQELAPAPKVDQQTAYGTLYRYALSVGMTNIHELAQFIAQCAAETGDFKHLGEIGNAAKRAHDYKNTLGNTSKKDALNYVGRGYIQLTGKNNYQEAGQALHGDPNYYLGQHAIRATEPKEAAKIAVWFWRKNVAPRVKSFADTDAVTRAINGQHAHKAEIEKRKDMFAAYLDIIQNFYKNRKA